MRKLILVSILSMALIFCQMPTTEAWTGTTHVKIVDEVYYSLPADAQKNLILKDMEEGSIAPDLKFFDFSNHKYPRAYTKAIYWLQKGQIEYKSGNYKQASYSFGVASHYISDSIAAPHAMNRTGPYHSLYELQASFLTPHVNICCDPLQSNVESGKLESQYSWNSWMMDRDNSHLNTDLDNAATACYLGIYQNIN
jgi:hypothetical protein